jgi:hypothetical protein
MLWWGRRPTQGSAKSLLAEVFQDNDIVFAAINNAVEYGNAEGSFLAILRAASSSLPGV